MVRYPLYNGGFIVLPEPAVKALYIIEKSSKLSKEKQIKLLEQSISYDIEDSNLNDIRNNLLAENKIEHPGSLAEVLALLITTGVVKDNIQSYEINYNGKKGIAKVERWGRDVVITFSFPEANFLQ